MKKLTTAVMLAFSCPFLSELASAENNSDTTKIKPLMVAQSQQQVEGPALTEQELNRLKRLMDRAEQAVLDQQYRRAVELYNNVIRSKENPHRPKALEFMGVALERLGQNARAKMAYEQLIQQYPEHDSVVRVQQRLNALLTAAAPLKQQLRGKKQQAEPEWEFYGGISQFYRRDENTTEIDDREETSVNRSSLSNDVYMTGRYRGEKYDAKLRLSAGYDHDFLDDEDSESKVSTLYLDMIDREKKHSLRVGRQTESRGGILGRFDGLIARYLATDKLKYNFVVGFPVESSTSGEINTDQYFYGINADLGSDSKDWNYNVFIIEQYAHDILDRRAIGGEIRYFKNKNTLFSRVDYDLSYSDLNSIFVLGSWTNESEQIFNLSMNYRNSPILTTSNAIQSQSVDDLGELLALGFTEDEARQLAEDRTAESSTLTLGMVQPINEQFQVSGDVTFSTFGDTPASGGVEATEGTDLEISYFLQLIGNDLIKEGDTAIVGLRYSDLTSSQRYALLLNTRYPISTALRINPRLQTEYRHYDDDDTDQWIVRPSFRLNYRWTKKTTLELELGGEWSTRELTDSNTDTRSYYINLGYRHNF